MSYRSGLGVVLTRPAEAMTNAGVPIFDITGGCILVTYIIGTVVGVAMDATGNNLSLQFDDGIGAVCPMCTPIATASDPIGTIYYVSCLVGDPMRKLETAVALAGQGGMCGGIAAGLGALAKGYICGVGSIERLATAINVGTVRWTMCYTPLEEGVAVAVA